MTSKYIPLLVAKLDHLTSYSVSGLWTHWNPEREPGSGSLVRYDIRKKTRNWGRKGILSYGAFHKNYFQATLNLFRNAFYLWLKDHQVFLKVENCWSNAILTQKVRSLRQRSSKAALGLISPKSSFLFLHPETLFI